MSIGPPKPYHLSTSLHLQRQNNPFLSEDQQKRVARPIQLEGFIKDLLGEMRSIRQLYSVLERYNPVEDKLLYTRSLVDREIRKITPYGQVSSCFVGGIAGLSENGTVKGKYNITVGSNWLNKVYKKDIYSIDISGIAHSTFILSAIPCELPVREYESDISVYKCKALAWKLVDYDHAITRGKSKGTIVKRRKYMPVQFEVFVAKQTTHGDSITAGGDTIKRAVATLRRRTKISVMNALNADA